MITGIIVDGHPEPFTGKTFVEAAKRGAVEYPLPAAVAIKHYIEQPHGKEGALSVSGLILCPRQKFLASVYGDVINIKNIMKMLKGTAIHKQLEKGEDKDIIEREFKLEVEVLIGDDMYYLTGQFDSAFSRNGKTVIQDHKTTAATKKNTLASLAKNSKLWHIEQLNMYRWMWMKSTGIVADEMEITYYCAWEEVIAYRISPEHTNMWMTDEAIEKLIHSRYKEQVDMQASWTKLLDPDNHEKVSFPSINECHRRMCGDWMCAKCHHKSNCQAMGE